MCVSMSAEHLLYFHFIGAFYVLLLCITSDQIQRNVNIEAGRNVLTWAVRLNCLL